MEKLIEILDKVKIGTLSVEQAQQQVLDLFGVSGSAIADLNHIAINSAMNIMCLTDNELKVQDECGKIINAVRTFSKHYR